MPGLPQFGVHNNTTTPTQLSATENRYRRVNMTSPGSQTSLERPAAKRKRTDSLDVAEEFDVSRQISRRALSKLGGDKNHPSLGRTVLHFALRAREHAIYNRCQPSLCIKCRTRQASVVFEHDISPCVIFCEGCATDYDGPCPSCHGVVLGVTHMSKTKSKCMSCLHDYMNEEVFFVCGDSCRHLSCIGCAIKCARGAVAEKDLLLSEGGIRCPYNSKNDPHQNCTAVMTLAAIEQLYQISRSAGDLVITQCLAPGIHVPHPGPRPEQGNMSAVAHFACVRQWQSQHQKWLASQNTSERIPALTLREKEKLSTWSEGAFIPASRRMQCTRQGVFDVTDERGNRVRRECGRYFDGGEVKPFCAQKVECPYCSQESCRWCKGTDWHVGLNCVQAQIKDQLENPDASKRLVAATTKKCPYCNNAVTRYHGHGCHHIGYGIGGCPGCSKHWCFVCRGEFGKCGCDYQGSTFCKQDDIAQYLEDAEGGFSRDGRCGCLICPDCKPGHPCTSGSMGCNGECVVCKGIVPPVQPKALKADARKSKSDIILYLLYNNPDVERVHIDGLRELLKGGSIKCDMQARSVRKCLLHLQQNVEHCYTRSHLVQQALAFCVPSWVSLEEVRQVMALEQIDAELVLNVFATAANRWDLLDRPAFEACFSEFLRNAGPRQHSLAATTGCRRRRLPIVDEEEDSVKRAVVKSRLFDIFDVDGNGTINFKELVSGLLVLCGGSRVEKFRAVFSLFNCKFPKTPPLTPLTPLMLAVEREKKKKEEKFLTKPAMVSYLTSTFRVMYEFQPGSKDKIGVDADVVANAMVEQAFENAYDRLSLVKFEQWFAKGTRGDITTEVSSNPVDKEREVIKECVRIYLLNGGSHTWSRLGASEDNYFLSIWANDATAKTRIIVRETNVLGKVRLNAYVYAGMKVERVGNARLTFCVRNNYSFDTYLVQTTSRENFDRLLKEIKDRVPKTPLMLAVESGHDEYQKLLRDRGLPWVRAMSMYNHAELPAHHSGPDQARAACLDLRLP